jgi:hypothetical protein
VIIAEALQLARQMGRTRRLRRLAQCRTREFHQLLAISVQHVRIDYCQHCGSVFVDGVIMNPPFAQAVRRRRPPTGRRTGPPEIAQLS